jgi:membrane dipeptidase
MIKKIIFFISIFIFFSFVLFFRGLSQNKDEYILNLHNKSIVFDAHSDVILRMLDKKVDIGKRLSDGHIDIPRLIEGGVDAQVFACFIHPRISPEFQIKRVLDMIDAVTEQIEKYPDKLELALNVDDILRISGENKIAVILGIEGGHSIQGDLGVLRQFHRLGVRILTLTWMNNNELADSSVPEPKNYGVYDKIKKRGGLTELGREVIKEMNRIGMVIDVSHSSDETFWDVIEISTKPIIASHSCVWELNNHHRNMKDDMLKALAKNGGVIGINFSSSYLDSNYAKLSKNERIKKPVTVDKVVDHIDYVVKIAGINNVGLGSDFDGINDPPNGLEDCAKLPNITKELVKKGYSEENIKKILGGNFIRVFKEVVGK